MREGGRGEEIWGEWRLQKEDEEKEDDERNIEEKEEGEMEEDDEKWVDLSIYEEKDDDKQRSWEDQVDYQNSVLQESETTIEGSGNFDIFYFYLKDWGFTTKFDTLLMFFFMFLSDHGP